MALDHAQSLRLGQRGVAPTPGVQLVVVASLPEVAYRGQIVYALDIDEFRVYDGDAWQIPTAAADGGLQMFVQATAPVADNVGDMWLKNTTYQIYVWDGTTWQEVQDPTADAAAAAAASAQADALEALGVANDAQATADGKVTTFYQSTEPALPGEDPQQGDIWFRTSDNRAFIYDSGDFVEIQDQAIVDALDQAGTAQATADQKISSYYQTTAPWPNGTAGHGNDIGDLWFDTDDLNKCYRWDGNWTPVQDGTIAVAQSDADAAAAAAAAAQADADAALVAATTDGSPPSASPNPFGVSGIGFFILKWDAITNADPVTYQVHISSTLGFTATLNNATTMVGNTTGTQMVVRNLPGADPAPGAPDPRVLDPDAVYYCRVIAFDADGAATQSLQAPCAVFRVTGVDLAADSVTAANIVAGTLTGELFSATVIMAGTFKTAESGQRVEWGIGGIFGYRSDGSLMVKFPTTDGEEALFDGEMIARSLSVLGGASFQSTENEITADATLTMQRGISSPTPTPVVGFDYETVTPSTASLSAAQKTDNDPNWGLGGPFDLVASEVTCLEWRTTNGGHFVFYQKRPNGSRAWYINSDGTPKLIAGKYFGDVKNYEVWSAMEVTGNPTSTKNGVYLMFRFMPGIGTDWYVSAPIGINRYVRQNTTAPPAIGYNGTDMYIAEVPSTNKLSIRVYVPNGSGGVFPAPITTYDSVAGYNAASSTSGLCAVTYSASGFDVPGSPARYVTAERANATNLKLVYTSGTGAGSIHPGGVAAGGSSWTSPNISAESFQSPVVGDKKGTCWDGSRFWTFCGDGKLYRHEAWATQFDPAVVSSSIWTKQTFYDSVGTTHETVPGPVKQYTARRRARNLWSPPAVTGSGGVDDPNTVRLYVARGATLPANSSFWLQTTATVPTTFTTFASSGTNPPTTNNFPNATPALIRNDNDTLAIDATGLIKSAPGQLYAGAIQVVEDPPYYYGYLSSTFSVPLSATTTITTWVSDTASGNGVFGLTNAITHSSGIFTINKAGTYRVACQIYWPGIAGGTGRRLLQSQKVAGAVLIQSNDVAPNSTATLPVSNIVDKEYRFAVGDQVQFRANHGQTGSASLSLSSNPDLTWMQIRYIGP